MKAALRILLPVLLAACGGSSESPPAKEGPASSNSTVTDAGAGGFVPPCASGQGCAPFVLAESAFLPFRVAATGEGVAYLSVNGIEEWTYATGTGKTLWTFTDDKHPRAFAVGKTSLLVAFEDGTVWRSRRDGSEPRQVFANAKGVMQIVARGDDFYWASFSDQKLMMIGADDATKVVSDDTCGALGLALAGDHAYVLSDTCRGVFTIPLAGGKRKTFWQDLEGGKPAYGAADATGLAWINLMSAQAGVHLTDLATGDDRLLLAFRDLEAPPDDGSTSGVSVALDAERVYFATRTAFASRDYDGRVYAVNRNDGTRVEISDTATNIKDVAVDDRLVVWAHWGMTSFGLMARMK